MSKNFSLLFVFGCLMGCGVVHKTSNHHVEDGYFRAGGAGISPSRVYLKVEEKAIDIYGTAEDTKIVDRENMLLSFPEASATAVPGFRLSQRSLDVDVLTMPIKFRPVSEGFPRQLNSSLNAAGYLGVHHDEYRVRYIAHPFGFFRRKISHFGYSAGVIAGLGSTAMTPWVTGNNISSEYNGVVWTRGLGCFMGINDFTLGMVVAWDHLMDENHRYWIYQDRHWIGLAFGINLN